MRPYFYTFILYSRGRGRTDLRGPCGESCRPDIKYKAYNVCTCTVRFTRAASHVVRLVACLDESGDGMVVVQNFVLHERDLHEVYV